VVELESLVVLLVTTLPCFFLDLVVVREESVVVATGLEFVVVVEESVELFLPWSSVTVVLLESV
jgi:hypothetical protein